MTKVRAPLTFSLAVMTVMGLIGPEEAQRVTDRSASLLRFWSDSEHPNLPSLDKAIALDRAFLEAGGGFAPILESYARQLDVSLMKSAACRVALGDDIAAAVREMADAVGSSLQVMHAGASPQVIHHAAAEVEEALKMLTILLARIQSFLPGNGAEHERGKPDDG